MVLQPHWGWGRACMTWVMGGMAAPAVQGAWRLKTRSQNCSASTCDLSVKQRSDVSRYGLPDADATTVPALTSSELFSTGAALGSDTAILLQAKVARTARKGVSYARACRAGQAPVQELMDTGWPPPFQHRLSPPIRQPASSKMKGKIICRAQLTA